MANQITIDRLKVYPLPRRGYRLTYGTCLSCGGSLLPMVWKEGDHYDLRVGALVMHGCGDRMQLPIASIEWLDQE